VIVNPSDRTGMADAICKALEMEESEQTMRIRKMQLRLKTYNVFAWTNDFLNQLELIKSEQKRIEVRYISAEIERNMIRRYGESHRRVIIFDYDGTLVPFARYPEQAKPSSRLIDQLQRLSDDPKNTVIICSGRQKEFLEQWFGHMNLYLIAEHGAIVKKPGEEWVFEADIDQEWKKSVYPLMQRYEERCHGSFIEGKMASLAWHFRNTDADFAFVRLQELKEELLELLTNHKFHLQIVEGQKVLEVKRRGYNKGTAASHMIDQIPSPDFILAIGDDHTDEDLFKALPPDAVTIKVGAFTSNAKYNLRRQNDVLSFIDKLIE